MAMAVVAVTPIPATSFTGKTALQGDGLAMAAVVHLLSVSRESALEGVALTIAVVALVSSFPGETALEGMGLCSVSPEKLLLKRCSWS